ncbi:prolyl-tRNA synthetase [Companilactobacillus paralimentarius DSM 13238 = JCM 10415]|uniref:Proline--tRNA ligase n=1 Tax=Companilactobacillus paralimentarius DSM 13238 = JCM 10415 TaxID=1122151 RepID=A0A0R1PHH1_9LACO|nr:proline--tRNA ligase [Companilactobacillus paralimentarius]KAE9564863.1 proline--tRNA ligase [Companilactobacillus paralimentarius]KRL30004.1 prolyl-tRNA synthetase [Companilactobacillus paralimentarius DSM 13238 = JCM 10415]MDR4934255.1 proline--tRNA ligase [Companilactobacillus paralimentarius]QFR68505.1 proline--tRNA ligase [Companilactobacillus paralimentarius]
MKQSKLYIPTLKQTPSDAEAVSHQLMLRAGYIRQVSAGVYAYLPLAWSVIQRIENIVRKEMEKIDVVEMRMPAILPADLWKESGRYETYGDNLFKFKDRHERDFILGPTHEETFTSVVKESLNSYKKLPLVLYQMQMKYRDEDRPRNGLLRGREFIMKDAYSFTANKEQLDVIFNQMEQAYRNIFDICGLNYRAIIGDAGAMGGTDSKEFSAIASIGEDTIAYSDDSDYSANLEMAASKMEENLVEDKKEAKVVDTPDVHTIDALAELLKVEPSRIMKAVAYMADDEPVMVMIRGDYDVNDVKLKNYLGADFLREATPDEVKDVFGSVPGFIGPKGINDKVKVLYDSSLVGLMNFVVGFNKANVHLFNANFEDIVDETPEFRDFRVIKEGEVSPDGHGHIKFTRGIEIGHIFKLGTKFSKALGANFLDENGKSNPLIMGSYGIGISRLLTAIIEQHSDENGIIWPVSLAPYQVHVVPIKYNNDVQGKLSDEIVELLQNEGYDVLLDDRKERPGVKFADSDLIGIPIRITVGKKAGDGIVELKIRSTGETIEVSKNELVNSVKILLKNQ